MENQSLPLCICRCTPSAWVPAIQTPHTTQGFCQHLFGPEDRKCSSEFARTWWESFGYEPTGESNDLGDDLPLLLLR